MRGLRGVAPSDELGAHLVDLPARCDALDEPDWRDVAYDVAYDVVYYWLTTFSDKPSVVVDALIDELTSPHVSRSRAVWALSFGVPSDRVGDVADVLTEACDAGHVDEDAFALVARYGDAAHRAWLAEIADHPRAPARVRTAAADALVAVLARDGSARHAEALRAARRDRAARALTRPSEDRSSVSVTCSG